MGTCFFTGIDTDCGKTFAVGMAARHLLSRGKTVITAKLAQTGARGQSPDILAHRRLMGAGLFDEDRDGLTCPFVFGFPASPHLAAALEGRGIDPARLREAFAGLEKRYETLLVEGAGGLLVPLTPSLSTADFVAGAGWPLVIVSSARLGSINHTLLTLEAAARRSIPVTGVVYNLHPEADPLIREDSRRIIEVAMKTLYPAAAIVDLPLVGDAGAPPPVDFGALLA